MVAFMQHTQSGTWLHVLYKHKKVKQLAQTNSE